MTTSALPISGHDRGVEWGDTISVLEGRHANIRKQSEIGQVRCALQNARGAFYRNVGICLIWVRCHTPTCPQNTPKPQMSITCARGSLWEKCLRLHPLMRYRGIRMSGLFCANQAQRKDQMNSTTMSACEGSLVMLRGAEVVGENIYPKQMRRGCTARHK